MSHDNTEFNFTETEHVILHSWDFLIRWNAVPKVLMTNTLIFVYLHALTLLVDGGYSLSEMDVTSKINNYCQN